MNEPIVKEVTVNTPISKVWQAITNKDEIKKWFAEFSGFKLEVGFEFTFTGGKDGREYLHLCKITDVLNEKKISYSWRYDGYKGNSLVTFELFKEGNKTRIKLTHEGIESFESEHADFAKENFIAGWETIIRTLLKNYLEKQ